MRLEAGHFTGNGIGARFYPVLYMLTRMGEACDWGTGLPLKAHMLGKMSKLEVHHIFPKAQLYKRNYRRSEVNAIANFCFLTKDTNLSISDHLPESYFPQIEAKYPGALASQWIPTDPALWKMERYRDFLDARRALLAAEANRRFEDLLHGDTRWLDGKIQPVAFPIAELSGSTSAGDDADLEALNAWVESHDLPLGEIGFEYVDSATGATTALFDLAWAQGVQPELSAPVAILLDPNSALLAAANRAGFRCFTSTADFKSYVEHEVLGLELV